MPVITVNIIIAAVIVVIVIVIIIAIVIIILQVNQNLAKRIENVARS